MAERYVGIDLNDKYAMISYYMEGMSEPGTFSSGYMGKRPDGGQKKISRYALTDC